MYKNDLSAAHARIRSLETALAAAAPSKKRGVAKPQAPPRPPPIPPAATGFPIYYHRPRTHWPLVRDFARAASKRPSFPYSRPESDSLLVWLAYVLCWPFARLVVPALSLLFIYLIAIPSVLVVLVPASALLLPFAVLGGLKIRGRKQRARSSFWNNKPSSFTLWMYWWFVGVYAAIGAMGYAIYWILV